MPTLIRKQVDPYFDRYIDFPTLLLTISRSRRWVYDELAKERSTFPLPIKSSPGKGGHLKWKVSEVQAWLDAQPRASFKRAA